MNPLIQLKTTTPLLLIALALLCFGLLPGAQAVVPPPDGGYPGFNTAEGQNALLASPPALRTQQLVGVRSLATPTAALTLVLARGALVLNTADSNTASWRCRTVAQHHRRREHGRWNCRARL